MHEHSHIYGYDGSRNFSDSLTNLLEKFIELRHYVDEYEIKWESIKLEIAKERANQNSRPENIVQKKIDSMNEIELKLFLEKIPENILKLYLK